jgi:hypothetical protein
MFFMTPFYIFVTIVYVIILINKIYYETKIFKLDIVQLEQKKKSRVAGVTTMAYRNGTMQYANNVAMGIIKAETDAADEEIFRRKLRYRHDMVNSCITAITDVFAKKP